MRRLIPGFLLLGLVPALAFAQAPKEHRGYGYVFFAPGFTTPGGTGTAHIAGGGEVSLYKGLGVGPEIGYVTPFRSFADGIGVGSLNGSYHFRPRRSQEDFTIFVTGGYSLAFRQGTANLANIGVGVNYWFRERMGLRPEVRDHFNVTGRIGQIIGFRIGLLFR